jgi:hypothetical protein
MIWQMPKHIYENWLKDELMDDSERKIWHPSYIFILKTKEVGEKGNKKRVLSENNTR